MKYPSTKTTIQEKTTGIPLSKFWKEPKIRVGLVFLR